MTWNGRQLMSYAEDGLNITYSYDSDGLRTRKTVNGVDHNYYYVDGQLMYESDDTYGYYYRYDQDGRLGLILRIRFSDNYKWYYYPVSNSRGDIMEIHDGNGAILAKYNYDAWGKLLSITDANGNALAEGSFAHLLSVRYRGYYYDSETGLYYLQSRYYDPETGRFLNADDVDYIGITGTNIGYNAFTYCENNAVTNWDPIGNNWLKKIKSILSSILSFFATNTVSVFSINNDAWMSSSQVMGNALQNVADAQSCTVIEATSNNFADEWNKLRSKYVIIHTHGSPTGIYDESEPQQAIFTTSDMNKLKRNKKIRCVIIISCSVAGDAGWLKANFANALSRKISSKGVVVGCRFGVSGSDTFFQPAFPNTNMPQPWMVYRNGLVIDRNLPNIISMQIVYNYLVEKGYI